MLCAHRWKPTLAAQRLQAVRVVWLQLLQALTVVRRHAMMGDDADARPEKLTADARPERLTLEESRKLILQGLGFNQKEATSGIMLSSGSPLPRLRLRQG